MLDSIDIGLLVYPTIEENRQTIPMKYFELTQAQQLQDDCDVHATNIILHGLPPDVYVLVNHQEAAKDIWDRVKLLMKGTKLLYQEPSQVNTKFLNALPSEGSKFVTDVKLVKSLYTTNYDQLYEYLSQHDRHANEVRITRERFFNVSTPQQFTPVYVEPIHHQHHYTSGEDPIECISKAMAFLSVVASRFPPSNNQLRTSSNPRNQATIQYGDMTRQSLQPKRPRNAAWFKEKWMLTEAQETEDLDAYDSYCDDLSTAKAVLMANLLSCDPEVLFEVITNKIDLLVQQYEQFTILEEESIDSGFARFNTIITSLKALDEGFYSKNYVRKFLRAHPKWRAKVTAIEESKDLSSLALDALIGNLKVHEVVMEKDSELYRGKKERVKSIALKAKKESSKDETSSSESDDEKTLWPDDASSLDNDSMQIEYDSLCEISLKIINKNKILKTKRDLLENEILELNEKIKKLERSKEVEIVYGWIKDSGYSKHMIDNKSLFSTYKAYDGGTRIETVVYPDFNHTGDYADCKSTSSVCTFIGYCLTSCFDKKQMAIAISMTEAEYVSDGKACQQALWMKQALIDYGIRLDAVSIMCDN
nr:UBN2 domain-containing protein [Tanacetum cinerariifolium]